ncbi:MAG: FG-GAP repeat protein [Planctomycetes bacterium]|nr:FG-GAP repeat protein [Planctomycetota bacterium]
MRSVLVVFALSQLLAAQPSYVWDLSVVPQTGQCTSYLFQSGGGYCGIPIDVGDFDNDGNLDYAITPLLADSGPYQNRTDSGEVLIMKGSGSVGGVINLLNPWEWSNVLLRVYGANNNDFAGTELVGADVTGDGIDDLVLSAMGADPQGRSRAGSVYIIPGGSGFTGVIDLASPPSSVTVIEGSNSVDRLGIWIAGGDINGDGVTDVIMGADGGDGISNSNQNRGEVVVLFGGGNWPATIDLANPPTGVALTTIYGVDNNDHVGTTLLGRDIDADGFDELIISAAMNRAGAANTGSGYTGADGPGNTRSNCGDTYVIWGRPIWPAVINLASPSSSAPNLTTIYGADSGDVLGEEIKAGDFDGDGYNDIALGALTADGQNNCCNWAGEAFIVYGGNWLRSQTLDARNFPANTSTIYGAGSSEISADSVSSADVNGDGCDDICIGSPYHNVVRPSGTANRAGQVDVVFGSPVRWPSQLVLGALPPEIVSRVIQGVDTDDFTSYSMEAGDFDNDGFGDVFPNAMRGDGYNNAASNAGEINIVSGRILARGTTTLGARPHIGTPVPFNALAEPGANYVAAFATTTTPAQSLPGGQSVALANDFLFTLSTAPGSSLFFGMAGTLDSQGRGQYGGAIPNDPALIGLQLFTAFATWTAPPLSFPTVSQVTAFVIEP